MNNLDKEALVNLVDRLRKIDDEMRVLTIEYNNVINEIWNRIPNLKNDDVFQKMDKPKKLVKKEK